MDFSKLKRADAAAGDGDDSGDREVEAIVKVDQALYVPQEIQVRARIDDFIFTCETTESVLKKVQEDTHVVSAEKSSKLRFIESEDDEPDHGDLGAGEEVVD